MRVCGAGFEVQDRRGEGLVAGSCGLPRSDPDLISHPAPTIQLWNPVSYTCKQCPSILIRITESFARSLR